MRKFCNVAMAILIMLFLPFITLGYIIWDVVEYGILKRKQRIIK